jgi:hypothetical protein
MMTDPVFDDSGTTWEDPPKPALSLTLVRPEDLLVLRVSFYDMRRDGDRMVPATAGQPGRMAIDLPTQHRAEQVQPVGATSVVPPALWCFPRPAANPGPDETIWQARLVFQVTTEVPLTWEGLLNWSAHQPIFPEVLKSVPPELQAGPPGPLATAINLPAGLWTAPVGDGAWGHARAPIELPDVTHMKASEIWYTAWRRPDGQAGVPFRVLGWHARQPGEQELDPVLGEGTRHQLAHASVAGDPWLADRYVLSTLGARFRMDVSLSEGQPVSYEVDMGRDRRAVIAGPGWLLPIGCPVRWTQTFERDFVVQHLIMGDFPYAPWAQKEIVVQVLDRTGKAATAPWRGMTMEDSVIHALDPGGGKPLCNFDNSARLFPVNLIDARGVPHRTAMQLTLVKDPALTAWNPQPEVAQQTLDLAGQSVHFADVDAAGFPPEFPPEAARLPTAGMTMRFLPRGPDGIDIHLEEATIAHPALDAFAPPGVHKVAFPDPANPGRIDLASGRFLSLVDGGPPLDFSKRADAVGGIASPSLKPAALSVTHGLLSTDAPSLPSPAEVFGSPGLSAKLFGTLDLVKLLQAPGFDPPKLLPVNNNDARGVRFEWKHDIAPPTTESGLDVLAARGGETTSLTLRASILQPQPGSGPPEPQIDIFGSLTNFKLQFPPPSASGPVKFPLVEVEFDDATFHKAPNQQPQVTANIAQVNFRGALAFLEVLKQFLPPDGFSNPPDLKVDAAGAHLAYSLGLPAIGIGVFSLTNVRLGAGMEIPFTDSSGTAVSFSFSRFENPFQVSVLGFAGHGYFGFAADTSGLKMLDAAIEFGGAIDFSFGPVEGGISAAGGLRFTYTRDNDDFAVTAYFHFHGGVSLFGIGVSLDATMGLEYESAGNCFEGEVQVELTVHLCFLSKSFGFVVHKTFAGSQPRSVSAMGVSPGPAALLKPSARFEDAFDLERWLAWNAAFAPAPAVTTGGG